MLTINLNPKILGVPYYTSPYPFKSVFHSLFTSALYLILWKAKLSRPLEAVYVKDFAYFNNIH